MLHMIQLTNSIISLILSANTTRAARRLPVLSLTPAKGEIFSPNPSSRPWSFPRIGTTTTPGFPARRQRCHVVMATVAPNWTAFLLTRVIIVREDRPGWWVVEEKCPRKWPRRSSIFPPSWCGRKIEGLRKIYMDNEFQ